MADKKDSLSITDSPDTAEHEEIEFPVQVFYIELDKLSMSKVRWHWHAEIEIIIINHGAATLLTDDQKFYLRAGQGILINQNVMHAIHPADENTNCTLYAVTFHPSFLFNYGDTIMAGKYMTPITSSPSMRTIELYEEDRWQEKILDLTNSIIAANLTKRYGYELVIKAHLCNLWACLLEKVVPQNVKANKQTMISQDETRVKSAIMYIEEHFHEQITLEDLADSIHVSKSECCRCFKRTLQLTPIEYLMKYRILQAANMLQRNDPKARSMSELAFSVGFNNASYFNKVFRQFLGCTPSEYKKRIKNDPTKDAGPFREFRL